MANASQHLDVASAEKYLMRYLAIDGVTGQEEAIANAIRDDLIALGVPASAIRFDDVAAKIPLPTQTGNLIVDLP
jgi:tripeptide aminopeptidase